MKLLGHVYVAIQSYPNKNQKLLAFGALLPETVFYTKNPALTFDQIHEGGLELYNFCVKNNLEMCDLARGCMTHSVKYGADSYNSLESLQKIGFMEEDIPKIAEALEIDIIAANARAHNLYDLVIDYFIDKKYPNILKIVKQTKTLNMHEIALVLSNCYEVSEEDVYNNLMNLWNKYDLSLMGSFEGLAKFWKSLAHDLKEKDPVNIEKTAGLLSDFYNKAEPRIDDFLKDVISSTKLRVSRAIGS